MNKNAWRKKTNAKLFTISKLRKAIRENGGVAIGLAGFSGSFKSNERADSEAVTSRTLEIMLGEAVDSRSPSTVYLISGATNLGVPRIGYTLCKRLGCKAVGVTAGSAISHAIAPLDYLTVVGKSFGDESEAFVSVLDELWVVGGGRQSRNECELASKSSIPITIIQGIGGISDELNPTTLDAKYVDIDHYLTENGR